MSKLVKNHQFSTTKSKVNWDDSWLDGQTYQLFESDLGAFSASGAKGKISTMRNLVAQYETKRIQVEASEDNKSLFIRIYNAPAA